MKKLKTLLEENMRRFGTKNLMPLHESALSDDDILDIIMTYTKDPDKGEAALIGYRERGDFGDASIESNVTRDPRWTGSESDLQRIVKEQSFEQSPQQLGSLNMQGVEVDDPIRDDLTDLEFRVSQIEKTLKIRQ